MLKGVKALSFFAILVVLNGCYPNYYTVKNTPATLGPHTTSYKDLISLPAPQEKIVAAVYKFRDQTGQYKPSQSGTSWSTAVTQGGTSILIKALEESGWFIPIERESLSELLNERKIIRSSRANYEGENTENLPVLPPMLYAGLLLDGGIISYETNVVTGGAGLKYFNAGASTQYREDQVTVYLRAISTSNGRILKTVYTTKKVLSQMVDASLFRYVEFKRLLEVETGFSYNEPTQFAVTAAIEKAVQSLIIEGVLDSLWILKDGNDINSEVVNRYLEEKEQLKNADVFGDLVTSSRSSSGIGLLVSGQTYSGEYPNSLTKAGGEIFAKLNLNPGLFLAPGLGINDISSDKLFNLHMININMSMYYHIFPENSLSPFLKFGFGMDNRSSAELNRHFKLDNKWFFSINGGAGLEYLFSDQLGLNLSFNCKYYLSDDVDNCTAGKYNDYYYGGSAGLIFYF